MRRAGVFFLSSLINTIMAFFNRPYSEANGNTQDDAIINFLREMADAQDRRFDAILKKIEQLETEIKELRALYKAPAPVVEQAPKAVAPVGAPVVETPVVSAAETVAAPVPEPEQQPQPKSYAILFFGPPAGAGFEASFSLPTGTDPRALYAIERTSDTEAFFYPLSDRFHRLRSNASSFLYPLCEVSGNLDSATAFSVQPSHFGKLRLVDGYWEMVSKCTIELE